MTTECMAPCPYCGQMVAVYGDGAMEQEELREVAGAKCMCEGAKRARQIRESYDRIEQVCGQSSVDNGFERALPDEAIAALRRLAEDIIDDRVRRAVLQIPGGNEVRLTDAIGSVKVKRTCKRQMEM